MSQSQKRKETLKTVRGYIFEMPSTKLDGSDEEDEDDDDDSWLDYSQMKNAFSGGTFVKYTKKPRTCRVKVRDLDNEAITHTCLGRFLLLDPWWQLTLTLGANNCVRGSVMYSVRQDADGIRRQKLVPLLVNSVFQKCVGKENAHPIMTLFEKSVRNRGKERTLSFENVEVELKQFKHAYPEHKTTVDNALKHGILQGVLRGVKYPQLLSFLCRLFPLTFLSCLLEPAESTLLRLQTAAQDTPWVFGFRAIMAAEFSVYGVEASHKAFENADLIQHIPATQKDALYMYEVLKNDATRNGHTYLPLPKLCNHYHWGHLDHQVSDWLPGLTFLAENKVTREERFDGARNIFLHHNWQAEVDITKGLKEVMSRGIQAKKPTWEVDFSSEELCRLRGDGDQWLAAQKVAGSPVMIMSGKGGCGKTTVVTQLIRHVCLLKKTPVDQTPNDDIDDLLANAEFEEITKPSNTEKPQSSNPAPQAPSSEKEEEKQVSPEQVLAMIEQASQSLENSQGDRGQGPSQRKQNQLQVDLTTDLIKYLATTGDTALSRTAVGRKILLTAPTGKAAKLLGHKAKMESCTLHRVIYSYRSFVKAQQQQKKENEGDSCDYDDPSQQNKSRNNHPAKEKDTISDDTTPDDTTPEGVWKYAHIEVLIVDECSLVSLRIFATLLNILIENTKLWKIVLLGDIRQLPSIEPGNFLSDMFTTFSERGLSVELRTNHRAESELIVSNATKISRRQLPVIDPTRNFHFFTVEDHLDSEDPERDSAIRYLLSHQAQLQCHTDSQLVAFRRADCDAINELCCKHYNNHTTKETTEAKSRYCFRVGDKICFRKNGLILNHRKRLRGYLKNYPEILEAFGIAEPAKKCEKKTGNLDATAVVNEILNNDKESARMAEETDAENTLSCCVQGAVEDSGRVHSSLSVNQACGRPNTCVNDGGSRTGARGKNGDKSCRTDSRPPLQPPASCSGEGDVRPIQVKTEPAWGDETNNTRMKIKQEVPWGDETNVSHVKIKQELPWGDETNVSHVKIKQELPWGEEANVSNTNINQGVPQNISSAMFDGVDNMDFDIHATDFGIKMEHVAQMGNVADTSIPSSSTFPCPTHSCKSKRTGDISLDDSTFEGSGSKAAAGDERKKEEKPDKLKTKEVRLCNGEVFFVMDDVTEREADSDRESRYLTISDRDPDCPRVICASFSALKRECRLRHAWARTIHTYQGSESDTVVYYVGPSKLQNWKHVYTAVTRGRKAVFIVGKERELRQAVWQMDRKRRSRLSHRLIDMMRSLQFEELHSMMRKINEQAKSALKPTTPPPFSSQPLLHTHNPTKPTLTTLSTTTTPLPSTSSAHLSSPHSAIDSFLDSDDSWIRDMSPVWTVDNSAGSCINTEGASCKNVNDASYTNAEKASRLNSDGARYTKDEDVNLKLTSDGAKYMKDKDDCHSNVEASHLTNTQASSHREAEDDIGWDSPDLYSSLEEDEILSVLDAGQNETRGLMVTPSKRQLSRDVVMDTPKRSRSDDPVDSIVTPVKRSLNI